jgi:hypothetical protein
MAPMLPHSEHYNRQINTQTNHTGNTNATVCQQSRDLSILFPTTYQWKVGQEVQLINLLYRACIKTLKGGTWGTAIKLLNVSFLRKWWIAKLAAGENSTCPWQASTLVCRSGDMIHRVMESAGSTTILVGWIRIIVIQQYSSQITTLILEQLTNGHAETEGI